MVRVSVCPSLTEGLSRSQMTPGQLLAVDHCKMLPLKPSHNAALAGLSSDILLSVASLKAPNNSLTDGL